MDENEQDIGPIDIVVIGYPPGAPMTGEAVPIMLDLVVRDGPSREDANLLRKADLFREEMGLDLKVTVGKSVPLAMERDPSPATSGPIPAQR